MTTASSSRLPRLLPGTDLRGLPISPSEAFVLVRVDGKLSVAELAEATGQPLDDVEALIERLAALNALTLEAPPPAPERAPASPPPAARPSGAFRMGRIVETVAHGSDAHHPAAALYDPAEIDEAVDLDMAQRRRILDRFYGMDDLNHYELFGVAHDADKKAIRAAYFEVVSFFHPDRHHGKNLGSFRAKLEKVFARLTEGYETLGRDSRRTEYDAYLRARSKTRAYDSGQANSAAHRAALAEVMRRIQAEASAESRGLSLPPSQPEPTPAQSSQQPASPSQPAVPAEPPRVPSDPTLRPSAHRPSSPEMRRRALARKLGLAPKASPGNTETETETPETTAETEAERLRDVGQRQEWATSELKRRYNDRVLAARTRQVETYTNAASQALAKGDAVGAANALRIAVSLAPDDAALTAQLNEVAGRAGSELAASYLGQAEYEERSENYLAAAKSYGRALQGNPSPHLYERLAHCLLAGDGNVREAGEMAKQAVLAEPNNPQARLTLARFYLKAGLKQSAEGELARAATLAPKDGTVADRIRRLQRDLG